MTNSSLSLFADAMLRRLLPWNGLSGQVLNDIKGRDPANFIATEHKSPPQADELIYLEGEWVTEFKEGQAVSSSPFSLRATTAFESFPSPAHIAHRVNLAWDGNPPPSIPPKLLGFACPITISYCRIGLDFFSPHFISSWIGSAPSVTKTLLIESDRTTLQLKIVAEGLKTKTADPLPAETFSALIEVLRQTIGIDLKADIEKCRRGLCDNRR